MYRFGTRSKKVLATCHPDIRTIMNEAIKIMDISCYEGIRSLEKQQEYFKDGKSHLDGVNKKSKHQGRRVDTEIYVNDKDAGNYSYDKDGKPIISYALDCMPYPIDWEDTIRNAYMGGILVGIADRLYEEGKISHKLLWGKDWDRDGNMKEHSFKDGPHIELYKPKS